MVVIKENPSQRNERGHCSALAHSKTPILQHVAFLNVGNDENMRKEVEILTTKLDLSL